MGTKSFDILAKEQFKFLETDFGFKLKKSKKEGWCHKLVYLNKISGVEIEYDYREAYLFIMIYRLVDGVLVKAPIFIDDETVLHGFGLDDILSLRDKKALMKPAYEYGESSPFYDEEEGLELFISRFADNLKKHALDLLTGDFSLFPKLDKIVKKRAREGRFEQ